MSIQLVTYNDKTVTPQDDALVYDSALRKSGMMYGADITIQSSTSLHISSGHGVVAGRKFTIDAENINVTLAGSGTLKGRLYVHLDLSNSANPIQILSQVASTLTDPVQEADCNITNGIYEFNLCTFDVSTTSISNLVDVTPRYKAQYKKLSAGNTTVTFDVPTYGDNLIEFYTSTGVNYSSITENNGQVTLTFETQPTDVGVYCEIKGA